MNTYTNCLPAWTIGPDAYKEIYNIVRRYGKKAAVIGGKIALSKAYDRIAAAIEGTGIELSAPIVYGTNATYETADIIAAMDEVKNADMIFAVGGGRAIDTCKCVADAVDKPIFTFPTIASNCAPVTAIGVFYNADDSFRSSFYPKRCPQHCFIDMDIIAESPAKLLWAGIGDALSKEYEVEMCTRNRTLPHTPLMARTMATCCTAPLIEYGKTALEQCEQNIAGYELQQVALSIIISTGLVSNFATTKSDYYYNSTLAHAVYAAATAVPACGPHHLHGEIVSFGVLTLFAYEGRTEELNNMIAFNDSIGLPITLAQLDITDADLEMMAEKASTTIEWTSTTYTYTKENFIKAMLTVDAAGKAFAANK